MTGEESILDVRQRFGATELYNELGLDLVRLEHGEAETAAVLDRGYLNLDGTLHGGMAAFVADTTMGLAARTILPAGAANRTLQLSVDFMASASAGERVRCIASVANQSGRFIWTTCEIACAEGGEVLARATSLHLKPNRPS